MKTYQTDVLIGKGKALYRKLHSPFSNDISKPGDSLDLGIRYIDANPEATFIESNFGGGKCNFIIGNDSSNWIKEQAVFDVLYCRDLYPGIDIKYYNAKPAFKSDYIVHPGADLSDIKIKYDNCNRLAINSAGDIIIQTSAGTISENIPKAYQIINGKEVIVDIKYVLEDSVTVSFRSGSYNPSFDLIIDPLLMFSTFIGGGDEDSFYTTGICRDDDGYIYLTAKTASTNFPVTPGSYDVSYNGGAFDVVVMKLSPDGDSLKYCTFLGGSGYDASCDLKLVNPDGTIAVLIGTQSADFPCTPGVYQTSLHGGPTDLSLVKLDPSGLPVFATFVGGSLDDIPFGLQIDQAGNFYVCGQTKGDFPITPGAFQSTHAGGWDVMLAKLNPSGTNLIWSTYIGGSGDDKGGPIIIDDQGNLYINAGASAGYPTTIGAYNTINNGGWDAAVTKVNPNGTALIYSTFIGGSGLDYPWKGFWLDSLYQITVSGICSSGFPVTPGAYDETFNGGGTDVFVSRLNSAGNGLIFSTLLGGSGADLGQDMIIRQNGDIVVVGIGGTGFPTTPCAYDQTFNGGSSDAIVSVLNSTGSQLLYSTYIGGSSVDKGIALIDDDPNIYLVGETTSSNFPVTTGSFDDTYNGVCDLFCLRLGTGSGLLAAFVAPDTVCSGQSITFSNTSVGATSYTWSFGDNTSSTVNAPTHVYTSNGNYSVILIASNSCGSDTAFFNIHIGNGQIVMQNIAICLGDSVFIGGAFQHNAGIFQDTIPGIGNSCDSIFITTLTVSQSYLNNQSISICSGDSVLIGGSFQYLPGVYYDTIFVTGTCDTVVRTTLTNLPLPSVLLPQDTGFCEGAFVTIAAISSGANFLWNTGDTTQAISIDQEGIYVVSVTDNNECHNTDTAIVHVYDNPHLNIVPSPVTICKDSSVRLQVNGANTYTWFPATTLSSAVDSIVWATPLSSITYTVTGLLNNGCMGDTSVLVSVINPPEARLPDSLFLCMGELLDLNAGYCYQCSYLWSNNDTTESIRILTPGEYWVRISRGGCSIRDTIKINECMEIWIPNVFTPNHDGINEYFIVKGINIEYFHMYIFNRWGNQLYETYDLLPGWDGKYKGKLCADGVYVYLIDYSGHGTGQQIIEKRVSGTVTILR